MEMTQKRSTQLQEALLIISKIPCFTTGDTTDSDFPSWPERETSDDFIEIHDN